MSRAAVELGQFFDLGGIEMSGQASGNLRGTCDAMGNYTANTDIELKGWRLAAPDRPAWLEELLAVKATVQGSRPDATRHSINQAVLGIRSGNDVLNAHLLRPVDARAATWQLPLALELRGELARWLARSAPIASVPGLQLAGTCELDAQGTFGSAATDLDRLVLRVSDFVYQAEGFEIAEPNIEVQGQGRWVADPGRIEIPDLLLASTTLSLRAERAWCDWVDDRPRLAGSLTFNADAKRLHGILADRETLSDIGAYRINGQISGKVDLAHQGQQTSAQLNAEATDAVIQQVAADRRGKKQLVDLWKEPKLRLFANAVYDQPTDRVVAESLRAESNALVMAATGTIAELTGPMLLDANGTINYDLAQWTPLLRDYLGPELVLVGRDTAEFRIGGPLVAGANEVESLAMRLTGKASAGWQAASCYGLMVGPARLEAQLANGALQFSPLQVSVNEGTLTASPLLKIAPEPVRLTLPPGLVLSNVRFSPENCDQLFKYVAPVVSDATRCDGKFSLELAECKYKFEKPDRSDFAGKLTVHQLDVLPGPLAEQYVLIGKQIESLLQNRPLPSPDAGRQGALMRIDSQEINFRLENGRVYHDRMAVRAGAALIYTSGSVGLDQSLAIDTEIPVQASWIEGRPFLQGLRGQVLRVPIRGSLQNPKADNKALAQASAQILRGAAQRTIADELNKQFDRLLPPAR
jgi:hypothetical protein